MHTSVFRKELFPVAPAGQTQGPAKDVAPHHQAMLSFLMVNFAAAE
jgi:hypothetical protein